MDDKPTQDLATRAFQKRVLDELIALRAGRIRKLAKLTVTELPLRSVTRNFALTSQNSGRSKRPWRKTSRL
jgi:hypothetical protein